jgi:hypothetical protein
MFDEHLAWQTAVKLQRRVSVGTLIVDWDGMGQMKVHQRENDSEASLPAPQSQTRTRTRTIRIQDSKSNPTKPTSSKTPRVLSKSRSQSTTDKTQAAPRHDSAVSTHDYKHSSYSRSRTSSTSVHFHRPPSTSDSIKVHYSPRTNTATGVDPATHFAYDYNGQIVHVYRDESPAVNEYWHVPVETYRSGMPIVEVSGPKVNRKGEKKEKRLPALPVGIQGMKSKVLGFVKTLFAKLDRMGVLGRMKREREKTRRMESWVCEGYVT